MADRRKGERSTLDRVVEGTTQATAPALRNRGGRPHGSRNRRTEAYAALLIGKVGTDPLLIATRIAAKDVLDPDVVEKLAKTWDCSRHEAVKLWAAINRDVQDYLHQRLPRAVVLNPGAPGSGERVVIEIDGEFCDVTPEDEAC